MVGAGVAFHASNSRLTSVVTRGCSACWPPRRPKSQWNTSLRWRRSAVQSAARLSRSTVSRSAERLRMGGPGGAATASRLAKRQYRQRHGERLNAARRRDPIPERTCRTCGADVYAGPPEPEILPALVPGAPVPHAARDRIPSGPADPAARRADDGTVADETSISVGLIAERDVVADARFAWNAAVSAQVARPLLSGDSSSAAAVRVTAAPSTPKQRRRLLSRQATAVTRGAFASSSPALVRQRRLRRRPQEALADAIRAPSREERSQLLSPPGAHYCC